MEKLKIKINCERGPLLATEQLSLFSLSNEFAHRIQILLNLYSITDKFAHLLLGLRREISVGKLKNDDWFNVNSHVLLFDGFECFC